MNFDKVNNFEDFQKVCSKLTKKEKGDYFELLNKYTCLCHYVFNKEIEECWLYSEVPYEVSKLLRLPKNDKGIDLIVKYKDQTYGVVQSKYRTNIEEVVTYGELATFFAQILEQKGRVKPIYMTNTRNIVEEISKNDVLSFNYDFFASLDKEFFDNIRSFINTKKVPDYISKVPRDYQIKCENKVVEYLFKNSRGHLIMACGTGKSYVSYLIDKSMNVKKTVIFVPSLYLLTQMYLTFVKENCGYSKYLLIGSDADLKNEKQDYQQVEITTDKKKINKKINTNKKLIVICTYQSSELLEGHEFDFGIFDEAHKTVGNKDSHFSFALFDENISIEKRLFITATKRVYNGKNEDIVSMNDEKIYGQCIFEYNIRQGIDEGHLSEYVIEIMKIEDNDIKEYKSKNSLVSDEEDIYGSHFIMCMLMIKQLFDNGKIHHLLSYHSSIEKARAFGLLLMKHCPDVCVLHLNGSFSCSRRNKIIESFCKNKKAIITSSQVLNEGVDIPIVDSVCFVEGRSSEINIVQCIGRALRKKQGEIKLAHILVPIIEDEMEDSKVFGNLIKVVQTLGDHDNLLIEYFKTKNAGNPVNKKLVRVSNYNDNEVEEVAGVEMNVFSNKIDTVILETVLSRLGKTVSYEQAKWIIRNSEIHNKETYYEHCKRDYRLPKEPEKTFGSKFAGWIDYFSIERDCYDLDECIEEVNEYLKKYPELRNEQLNLTKVCEKMCKLDLNFPPNGMWSDYYSKNLHEIIVLNSKKKVSNISF